MLRQRNGSFIGNVDHQVATRQCSLRLHCCSLVHDRGGWPEQLRSLKSRAVGTLSCAVPTPAHHHEHNRSPVNHPSAYALQTVRRKDCSEAMLSLAYSEVERSVWSLVAGATMMPRNPARLYGPPKLLIDSLPSDHLVQPHKWQDQSPPCGRSHSLT